MSATAKASSPSNDAGDIDLMGWDTVFALSLDALNASIVSQKTTPKGFAAAASPAEGGAKVEGTWGDWSVIGGEGEGITLKCPVETGVLTVPEASTYKLDGGYVEVTITLVKNASSQELADDTAAPGTGSTKKFQANPSKEQFQAPVVSKVSFGSVTGLAVYAAEAGFNAYFGSNIAEFDAVFAAVRLEEEAISKDKQWLKPVESLYALAKREGAQKGQIEEAFAILNLNSQPSGSLPQQNFDIRMFDVFTSTKTATNSVFAMSSALSMKNIVQNAAQHCVMGSTIDDFHIVNAGITVSNKNTLNWGKFKLQKDSDETVTPVISPGDFQLTLDGMDFHLSISQASFTTPDGSADVKLTADQYFNLGAVKLGNGKYYFAPAPGLGTNSIRADVSPNKGFEIAMIIESIVIGVALGFLGAGIGEALGGAAEGATEGAEGVVTASEDSVSDAIDSMSDSEVSELTDSSVEDATDSIASDGENTQGKSGIFANKYKVWGGVLGGMFGIPIGVLPQIMTAIWNDRITEGNVPTVDAFATNFTGAIQWPQVKSWEVTGGTFRAAFLLGGNATQK